MVVLGVGVSKDILTRIAEKANMEAEDTPASNVIHISKVPSATPRFFEAAEEEGCRAEWGQTGQIIVRGAPDAH